MSRLDPNTYTRCPGKPWAVFGGRVLLGWYATRKEARWHAARDRPLWRAQFGSTVSVFKQEA